MLAGEAGSDAPGPAADGLASMALLTPLPHTATARLALFASPAGSEAVAMATPWPDRLPEAAPVARGWSSLVGRGPRLELPDPVLAEAVAAARRSLPLSHRVARQGAETDQERPPSDHRITSGTGGRGRTVTPAGEVMEILGALAWWGDVAAVDRALVGWPEGQQRGGGFGDPAATAAALRALALHAQASGDPGPAAAWLPEVGGAIEALGRGVRRPPAGTDPRVLAEGLDAGAQLLAGLDQPEAARRVAEDAARAWSAASGPPPGRTGPPTPRAEAAAAVAAARAGGPVPGLWALLRAATSTWTWSDPEAWAGDDGLVTARLLDVVARLLVADRPTGPALLPWLPPDWWGRGWEVHEAPTRWGPLSCAVRWHGERPAVLWELGEPRPGITGTVVLTAPGLDPTWTGTGATGEALLGPVARPAEAEAPSDPAPPGPGGRGVAVAAPPRSVWRPQDAGPDAPPEPASDPRPDPGSGDGPPDGADGSFS